MINIKTLSPKIILDIRYATTNNFTGKKLYSVGECFLAEPAANRLLRVQKKLEKEGLGLKVFDCYRPLSVQQKLWDVVPDTRYVASPITGSRHNRGTAVDLTLVNAKGKELPMPTEFDDFSKKAHRDYAALPKNIIRNREKLRRAMEDEGFMSLPTEWWHFDDPLWKNYALRNEPLHSPALAKDLKTEWAARPLSGKERQLVVVVSGAWADTTGKLVRFNKKSGAWGQDGPAWKVSLGKKGMAWGQGRHTPLEGQKIKREGDKTSPAGIFPIGKSFGRAPKAPEGSLWPYTKIEPGWLCVDDPKSSAYNQIVDPKKRKKDWRSAEEMNRKDGLYEKLIVVDQNHPSVLKGGGSCIFFHKWRRKGAATAGCTAMREENLSALMRWLDPKAHPALIQLPQPIYKKMRREWGLP